MEFEELLNSKIDKETLAACILAYLSLEEKEHTQNNQEKNVPHCIYEEEVEKYISEPCVKVCRNSWNKNLFTEQPIIKNDEILIKYNFLNKQNTKIFRELICKDKKHYSYSEDGYPIIKVEYNNSKTNEQISDELSKLAEPLKIQDITTGYMTKEEFLMNVCGCEKVEGLKEYKNDTENVKIVFDPTKVNKDFDEYIKYHNFEELYVKSEERIYKNKFYLEAHKKFLSENKTGENN